MKKRIGIIGQFPLPMHGLSKALETLYNSYLNEKFDLKKIDISDNKKFLINLFKILFSKLDLYYLTISQSKFGNIRDLIIIKIIQFKRRKIIIHLHGGGFRNILDNEFSNYQKKINYKILSKVDGGIVLGDSLKYIFREIIPEKKIYVVKNCVDNEFVLSDKEFEEKLNLLKEKKKFTILYLSNFIKDKGYEHVLELAKLVKEKEDERFCFKFAGKFFSEKEEKEFWDYIKNNKLNEIIEYKGVVGGQQKLELLKESDIFILLTKYKNEGQPISIIESAINGLKIVTTDHAGIKDILSDKEMNIYDKKEINIEKIYKEILIEYNFKKNEIINILKNNRNKIKEQFSETSYIEDIEKIFNEI